MSALISMLIAAASPDCAAFGERVAEPVRGISTSITEHRLASVQGTVDLGPFQVASGYTFRSSDPRFLEAEMRGHVLAHSCGFGLVHLEGAKTAVPDTLSFFRRRGEELLGAERDAREAGALPWVPRYALVSSWPFGRCKAPLFLGVMRPVDGAENSLIVFFAAPEHRYGTRLLARLPIALQFVSVAPAVHGLDRFDFRGKGKNVYHNLSLQARSGDYRTLCG